MTKISTSWGGYLGNGEKIKCSGQKSQCPKATHFLLFWTVWLVVLSVVKQKDMSISHCLQLLLSGGDALAMIAVKVSKFETEL